MLDVIITLLGAGVLLGVWVALYDSNRFVVRKYRVEDARIRKSVRGAVIADLHNKSYGRENERLLEAIEKQQPDFILIAGDILTAKPGKSMEPALHLLRELSGKYPIYYGNGNHEHRLKLYPEVYGSMGEEYGKALEEMGIVPLVNSHAELPEAGIAIYGAEIDRFYYKRFRVQKMEEGYLTDILGQAPGELYTVLLAHNPDYFPQYAAWGADLTVSGHVHGGIVRVPFWGKGVLSPTLRLFPEYDGGIFKSRGKVMLLSRGLGTHTIPIRVFNPGELWIVDFAGKQETPQESAAGE